MKTLPVFIATFTPRNERSRIRRMLARLLLPLLLLSLPALATEVYQSTDEDGNPVFSDQPGDNSEAIEIQDPNVGDSIDVPPPSPSPPPEPEPEPAPEIVPSEELVAEDDGDDGGRRRLRVIAKPRPHPHRGR